MICSGVQLVSVAVLCGQCVAQILFHRPSKRVGAGPNGLRGHVRFGCTDWSDAMCGGCDVW